jgi:hypothetical protein
MYSILKKIKKKLELSVPIPFECAKDETNALNLLHGIEGWIQLMVFVELGF